MPASAAFAYLSSACATLLALGAAARAQRSVPRWSFAAGMIVLALDALLASWSAQATDLDRLQHWHRWRVGVLSFAPGLWLLFSLTYARGHAPRWSGKTGALLAVTMLLPVFALLSRDDVFLAPLGSDGFASEIHFFRLRWAGTALYALFLLGAIGVVMNLERTFRASVGTIRWRIKFMLLGAGTIFVARIYTGSQILVFRASDPTLDAINAGALIVATPLILRSFFRAGHFDLDVYPSHSVLRSSLTLLLAGVYLVLIGALAKVVSYLGGDAAFALKAFLVLVGLVALALVLQSDRAQQRLAQFVSRHFQRPLYDYRTVWKKATDATTSRVDQTDLARAIAAQIAETFHSLSVNLWVANEKKDTLRLTASTSLRHADDAHANGGEFAAADVLRHFQTRPDPIDLESAAGTWASALRAAHPSQFPNGGRRCGVPLIGRGEVLGVITLGDRIGATPWSTQDFEMLKCVADHAAASLMNAQLSQRLLEARELAAFQTMAAFFVHDLKNAASTLSLMLQNLPAHFANPEFRTDALRGVEKAVTHVNRLIGRLGQLRHETTIKFASADLNAVVTQALADCELPAGIALLKEFQALPPVPLDVGQFNKVITNLVLNATDALTPGGHVRVTTAAQDDWVVLTVADNGCGMSDEFVARSLFRPFQTTKKSGLGIGMFQSKTIVEAHGGRIAVASEAGKGTTFQVFLPVRTSAHPHSTPINATPALATPFHEAEITAG